MKSIKLLWVLGLLMLMVVVMAACGSGGGGGGSSGGLTVNVEGSEFAYKPPEITAKPGQRVTVNFKNTGSVEHTFVLKDPTFKLTAQPGQTVLGTFTAPAAAGTYEIHCDIAGHTEAGMVGKLVVQ